MDVTMSEEEGRIAFPNGAVLEMRADSETLDVALTAGDDPDVLVKFERFRTQEKEKTPLA